MYRVTFTSLIAVTLLLVYVHSIRADGFEPEESGANDFGNPESIDRRHFAIMDQNRVQANSRSRFAPLRPFGVNQGGTGGAGNAQIQQGDNSQSSVSGGNGGRGGRVFGTGFRNTGGNGGSGNVQSQQGVNSFSDISGGNGGDAGGVDKRMFQMLNSFDETPSDQGLNMGGTGGDGSVQIQGGSDSSISASGGNGGAGGSVFGSQSGGLPPSESFTNLQSSGSFEKRGGNSSTNASRVVPDFDDRE